MMTKMATTILILFAAFAFALYTEVAQAAIILETYDLEVFTDNGDYNDDPRLDLKVEFYDNEDGRVLFKFLNDSTIASSIEGIYFDDGSLLGISSIENGPGTAFSQGASPPNLPAGNELLPPFVTSQGFLADSDSPVPANGVNATPDPLDEDEWVAITFDLINGATPNDVYTELETGLLLRIGVHVIALPDGSSEAAVNTPEPATLALLTIGAGIAVFSRKPVRR